MKIREMEGYILTLAEIDKNGATNHLIPNILIPFEIKHTVL